MKCTPENAPFPLKLHNRTVDKSNCLPAASKRPSLTPSESYLLRGAINLYRVPNSYTIDSRNHIIALQTVRPFIPRRSSSTPPHRKGWSTYWFISISSLPPNEDNPSEKTTDTYSLDPPEHYSPQIPLECQRLSPGEIR